MPGCGCYVSLVGDDVCSGCLRHDGAPTGGDGAPVNVQKDLKAGKSANRISRWGHELRRVLGKWIVPGLKKCRKLHEGRTARCGGGGPCGELGNSTRPGRGGGIGSRSAWLHACAGRGDQD